MSKFFYCKSDGYHAVIESPNRKNAIHKFVEIMNEMLEPEHWLYYKYVECEPVNIYFIENT